MAKRVANVKNTYQNKRRSGMNRSSEQSRRESFNRWDLHAPGSQRSLSQDSSQGRSRWAKQKRHRPKPSAPHPPRSGHTAPERSEKSEHVQQIDRFELFCAYHLGITKEKGYRPANIHDVARRFNVDAGVIRQALRAYGMDADNMFNVDFDITMAQIDIEVAPDGIDRVELARSVYDEFCKAPRKRRDWNRLLQEDARENTRIFGRF